MTNVLVFQCYFGNYKEYALLTLLLEAVMNTYLQSLEHGDLSGASIGEIHVHYKINFVRNKMDAESKIGDNVITCFQLQMPQGISNTIYALVLSVFPNKHYYPSPGMN